MWGRDFGQDLRFAVRSLRRRPGFTATAVAVLGLAIAASTTVFTLVDGIFFARPPDVSDPDRLVRVFRAWEGGGGGSLQNPDFEYFRENVSVLSGLAAWGGSQTVAFSTTAVDGGQARLLHVSDNYFSVLGTTPAAGRWFLPEENETAGTHPVVVLSHGFWTRAYGADPKVVGQQVALNGSPFTVVGIASPSFRGLSITDPPPDLWAPIAIYGTLTRAQESAWWERQPQYTSRWLSVVGRLSPGATAAAAEANLMSLWDGLTYEAKDENETVWVRQQYLYTPAAAETLRSLSTVLLATVAVVLTIAAANVAVLLLSRVSARVREIGIRVALGARRRRVLRQFATESLVLGAMAGALGVALAYVLSDLATALLPLAIDEPFRPDLRIAGAGLGLSLFTAALIGLATASRATGTDVRGAIRGDPSGLGRRSLRSWLVVVQLSLSLVLVAGAVLFTKSFRAASHQDLGFSSEDRLVVRVNLRTAGYEGDRVPAFIQEALLGLESLPGVRTAATTRMIPFRGDWTSSFDPPPGARANDGEGRIRTGMNVISPGYFEAMGMPIVEGRPLTSEDTDGAPSAIVVNQTLADQVWPGTSALGQTLPVLGGDFTVVGVAGPATYYELGEAPSPQTWGSVFQAPVPDVSFVVATDVPALGLIEAVQSAIRDLDPELPVAEVTTLEAVVESETARYRVTAVLVGIFGALALFLASAGLHGVVAVLVGQQTREIGVRMALGASSRRIATQVLSLSGRLALFGVILGGMVSLLLRGVAEGLLYGVTPDDPTGILLAGALLLMVAVAASLAPARRAMRVEPVEAMRSE